MGAFRTHYRVGQPWGRPAVRLLAFLRCLSAALGTMLMCSLPSPQKKTGALRGLCAVLLCSPTVLRYHAFVQPAITPEKRSAEPEAATPADVTPIPLQYTPMPATSHCYEMVDGVMHVYADENSRENLFQVGARALTVGVPILFSSMPTRDDVRHLKLWANSDSFQQVAILVKHPCSSSSPSPANKCGRILTCKQHESDKVLSTVPLIRVSSALCIENPAKQQLVKVALPSEVVSDPVCPHIHLVQWSPDAANLSHPSAH
eukprot:1161479-Pelagomonas_calceolata.AAC.6